jgi:tetratricopeptide (TPR) repeat protein
MPLLRTLSRGRRLFLANAAALVAVVALSASAAAQPAQASHPKTPAAQLAQAKALTTQAELDYKVGHFQQALDGYTQAYELVPTPALLFNIGQCHRLLKNYERAVFFFRGYLRDKPDAPNRTVVDGLVAESQRLLEEEQAQAKKEADEREARQLAEEQSRAEDEARARQPVATLPPPQPKSPVIRIAGLALAGAGVVAIGTGVVFGLKSKAAANDIDQVSAQMGTWTPADQSLYSSGQHEATAATVLYVAGGLAVAAGGVLAFLGWPRKSLDSAPTAAFAPGPSGGTLIVRGRF